VKLVTGGLEMLVESIIAISRTADLIKRRGKKRRPKLGKHKTSRKKGSQAGKEDVVINCQFIPDGEMWGDVKGLIG